MITATAAERNGHVEVVVEADVLAVSVMLWLDEVDATWSDNFFHLLPGEARRVLVRPAINLTADEVAARLRWRTL